MLVQIQYFSRVHVNRATGKNIEFELTSLLSQYADYRQIPILFVIVQSVADNKFVLDIEPDIIGFDRSGALFHFSKKHTTMHTQRFYLSPHAVNDCCKLVYTFQDI